MPERNPKPLRHLGENGADRFPQVDVLVGIEMTGSMAHKVMKDIQLAGYFVADGSRILQGDYGIQGDPFCRTKDLFAQIDMQSKAQARMIPGVCRRLSGSWPAHH